MKTYCIKKGYRPNFAPNYYLDTPAEGVIYQPDVYRFALHLCQTSGARLLIDIGSGNGDKLQPFLELGMQVLCLDLGENCQLLQRRYPSIEVVPTDFELGLPEIPDEILREAVVICSDVVEHLIEPHLLFKSLAHMAAVARFVCISTPDRDRARGPGDMGPPANRAHVREWNLSEFHAVASKYGFSTRLLGRTINTNVHRWKNNILLLDGTETRVALSPPKRVLAVMNAYNEVDILPEVLSHLLAQGVDVLALDNWSTDGTWELLQKAAQDNPRVRCARFPDAPTAQYEWKRQLENVETLAANCGYDWVLHHDADELRFSPWADATLAEAIAYVDALGYNAIDFTVVDHRFLTGQPAQAPYRESLVGFEFGRKPGHRLQIKGWKCAVGQVNLAASGGHEAAFTDRKVYPLKFLNRHYPLRNPEQARQKVFEHRKPRFAHERRTMGWHSQYDRFESPQDIRWQAHELILCGPHEFETDYLVERLSGIGLFD